MKFIVLLNGKPFVRGGDMFAPRGPELLAWEDIHDLDIDVGTAEALASLFNQLQEEPGLSVASDNDHGLIVLPMREEPAPEPVAPPPRSPRYASLELSGFGETGGHEALVYSLRAWDEATSRYATLGEIRLDQHRNNGDATLF